jgi:hypothetical protein
MINGILQQGRAACATKRATFVTKEAVKGTAGTTKSKERALESRERGRRLKSVEDRDDGRGVRVRIPTRLGPSRH